MAEEVVFDMFKNILKAETESFVREIARNYRRSEHVLLEKYLKPEYYLPIIRNTGFPINITDSSSK